MFEKIYELLKSMHFWTILGAIAGAVSAIMALYPYINPINDNEISIYVGHNSVSRKYNLKNDKRVAFLFHICSDNKTVKKIVPFCLFLRNNSDKPIDLYEYSIVTEHICLSDSVNKLHSVFDDEGFYIPKDDFLVQAERNVLKINYNSKIALYPKKNDANFRYWNIVIDQPIGIDGEIFQEHAMLSVRNKDWYRELDIDAVYFAQEAQDCITSYIDNYSDEYDDMFLITLSAGKVYDWGGRVIETLTVTDIERVESGFWESITRYKPSL